MIMRGFDKNDAEKLTVLHSNHEEEGTRLILHTIDSIFRYGSRLVIIWSSDKDVLILDAYFSRV